MPSLGNLHILQRDEHLDAISSSPQSPPNGKHPVAAYILVPVIIGVIAIGSLVAFFAVRYLRRRRLSEARLQDPNLDEKDFRRKRHSSRRHNLSETGMTTEEEAQRKALIEKSLASRSQRNSRADMEEQPMIPPAPAPNGDEWHAEPILVDRLRRERSNSEGQHAMSDDVSELSVPAPTRFRPESPSPLLDSAPGEWHAPHANLG